MVFCNAYLYKCNWASIMVTILILIDGFLQFCTDGDWDFNEDVTILILIDGFLQYYNMVIKMIDIKVTILILIDGFLQ